MALKHAWTGVAFTSQTYAFINQQTLSKYYIEPLGGPKLLRFLKKDSHWRTYIWETGCPFKSPSTSNWPGMVACHRQKKIIGPSLWFLSCTIVECTVQRVAYVQTVDTFHVWWAHWTCDVWNAYSARIKERLNIINASENGTGLHSYHPLDVAIHLECGYGWRTRTCDNFLLFVVTPQEINLIEFQPDRHQSQLLNIQFYCLLLLKSPCFWV